MYNQILLALSLSLFALSSCAPYSRIRPTPTPPPDFFNVYTLIGDRKLTRPSLSADGKRLAAFGGADLRSGILALYVIDLEIRQVLFVGDEKSRITSPAISPDGNLVAIDQFLGARHQIFITDLVTNQTSYLTDGFRPAWSPDGQRLAYIYAPSSPGEPDRRIQFRLYDFVTDVDALVFEIARVHGGAQGLTWLPDGSGLAFTASLDIQLDSQGMIIPGTNYEAFYTVALDDGNLRKIDAIPYGHLDFNFSPDSKKILYTPRIGSFVQVSDMHGYCHRIQTPLASLYWATISADSRTIVFETYYGLLVADTSLALGDNFWEVGDPCEVP